MSGLLTTQINYYMRIAIDINKKVGGTKAYEAEANTRDRFLVIKDNINKNFFYIKTKLDERERKRGDVQQINADIRLKIQEIYNQLERMRETVASEKGTNPAAQTVKYDVIEKLTAQTRELQDLIDSSSEIEKRLIGKERDQTVTEMRQQLMEGPVTSRFNSKPGTTTEADREKMKEWEKLDRELDEGIQEVIDGIKRWKESLKTTGALIEESDRKIVELTTKVDTVNEDLFHSNKELKGIIAKFRKPHKFCLDIVLVLILVALIVGIIKLSGR